MGCLDQGSAHLLAVGSAEGDGGSKPRYGCSASQRLDKKVCRDWREDGQCRRRPTPDLGVRVVKRSNQRLHGRFAEFCDGYFNLRPKPLFGLDASP
jgi:hypothetical protein